MNKKLKNIALTGLILTAGLSLAACGKSTSASHTKTYTIGVASDAEKAEWTQVAKDVKKDNINLKVKEFTDYTLENPSLEDGSLDLNAFQHTAFLNNWNQENHGDLVGIGYTYISPFGLYSKKITNYNQLKDGDKVAIPNDPTNEGRSLQLLDAIHVITLKKNAPSSPSLKDIATYNKKIKIELLEGDQIVAALPDVTAATINTNFVQDQLHTTPEKAALYIDTDHQAHVNSIYKNIVVVKKDKKDNADFQKLVKAYQTEAVAKIIEKGGDKPAW